MASGRTDSSADRPPGRSTVTTRPTHLVGPATSTVAGPTAAPDEAVVRAVLDGDREAFRILVDRELAGVVRAAARILDDVAEAEDIAQETFVIAYRSLASWRAEGPFGAWVARIAIRLALRRAARRRVVPWTQPGQAIVDGDEPILAARVATSDPEHAAVRGEEARMVRRAVAALAEPYREVVALRFFADRSLDEIAVLTGRPLGTVKTHLRRGLIRLRGGLDVGGAG